MIYDASNVEVPCKVFDVQRCEEIREVLSIDTDRLVVTCAQLPFQVIGEQVVTFVVKPDNIRVINGKSGRPVLFLLNSVDDEETQNESERNSIAA